MNTLNVKLKMHGEGNTEEDYLNILIVNNFPIGKIEKIGTNANSFLGQLINTAQNTTQSTARKKESNKIKRGFKPTSNLIYKGQNIVQDSNVYFIFDTENNFDANGIINNKSIYNIVKKPENSEKLDILKKLRKKIFFTNDRFEFWLALHFDKSAKIDTYNTIIKSFRVLHGKQIHPKNTLPYDKNNLSDTCKESKARYDDILDRKHKNDKISILTETDEAFSEMHLLIDELNKP